MGIGGCVVALGLILPATTLTAGSLDTKALQLDFERLAHGFDGRVGVCAVADSGKACINESQRFSLQSVVKLVVAMAVMNAVDSHLLRLDTPVSVHKEDLSLFVEPIANIVNAQGVFQTTIGDLIRRAIVDSDSAANDILLRRLGGPQIVQAFLDRKGIAGVRVDRDERHLQTEIVGLTWKPEYVDEEVLDKAIKAVPEAVRDAAEHRYQTDVRDTATPAGMAALLQLMANGTLLSPSSWRYLIGVMKQTVTFPDRLKAGTAPGWTIAHKTGTSGTWKGTVIATNDVGILRAPDGGSVIVVAFIADSRAPEKHRAAVMANVARAVIARYR